MKVILLEDVKSLGKKGEVVNVNDGYARNFVLPKKLGVEATGKNMNDLKLQKANEEKVAKEHLEAAQAFAKRWRMIMWSFPSRPEKAAEPLAPFPPKKLQQHIRSSAARKLIRRKSFFRNLLRALEFMKLL